MTTKSDIERLFPTERQEGGDHYQKHQIQPSRNTIPVS
jgi:hypothetical protein